MIGVIEKKRPAGGVGDDAAVARAFPVVVRREDRVLRMSFPWAEQLSRARDTQLVVAPAAAARVGGVEHVEPLAAPYDERSFDEVRFPRRLVPQDFYGLADQLSSVEGQRLRQERRRKLAAVAVLLPHEIPPAELVLNRRGIYRARVLADHGSAVGVRPLGLRRISDRDAERPVLLPRRVVHEEASAVLVDFRRPVAAGRPRRRRVEDVSREPPVHEIGGMEQRKDRRPLRRGGRRPVVAAYTNYRRVGVIPGEHGVLVRSGGCRLSRLALASMAWQQRRDQSQNERQSAPWHALILEPFSEML